MNKIATLTFQNADNYGAILQCYALQKAIEKLGYESMVLNYNCEYLSKPWGIAAFRRKGLVRYILGNINALLRQMRRKEFSAFRKMIKMTKLIKKSELSKINNEFEKFVVGSDQVWNYDLTDMDTTYLLDFVTDNNKKCSYAASFGVKKLPSKYEKNYQRLLKQFSYISVREESASQLMDELVGVSCDVVIDPTLLLSAEEWEKVAITPKLKEKYIFLYQASASKKMLSFAKKLQKKTGLKIVTAPFPMGYPGKFTADIKCGPQRWLGYIKNAEYIVTDSFHGTVFSIIFEKQLFVCLNDYSTRIINLLNTMDKNECLVTEDTEIEIIKRIDYLKTKQKVLDERMKSISVLRNMIS